MWHLIGLHILTILIIGVILFRVLIVLFGYYRGRNIKKRRWKLSKEYDIRRSEIILGYLLALIIVLVLCFLIIDLKIRGVP